MGSAVQKETPIGCDGGRGRGLRMEADRWRPQRAQKQKKQKANSKLVSRARRPQDRQAAHKTGGGAEGGQEVGRRDIYTTEKREMLTLESRL